LGDALEDVWFAEDSLERVGPNPTPQEWRYSIWQDNVYLRLITNVIYDDPGEDEKGDRWETEEEKEVTRIAEKAEVELPAIVECRQVLGGNSPGFVSQDEPIEIHITLEPTGDAFAAYQRIVSAPPFAWLHGEDSRGFPMSSWRRPHGEDAILLAPGIKSATVTCEHWSTPERLITLSGPRRKSVRPSPDVP
jgi:hypothetical protein